jgi:hypothetical protein
VTTISETEYINREEQQVKEDRRQDVTSQKAVTFSNTAMTTSNLAHAKLFTKQWTLSRVVYG